MKSHFHPKTLLFYGAMIGSVLVLFRIVSDYGEKHLQAPPDVNGRYVSSQPLPGCPDSTRLALTILQSGVYLHGLVQVEEADAEAPANVSPDKATLNGRWEQSQVVLSGSTDALAKCAPVDSASTEISIQGQISSSDSGAPAILTGQTTIAGSEPWSFQAERQATAKKLSDH